jgi:hypothetical protein
MSSKQPESDKPDYRDRHYGQAGGNQTGPSLTGSDEAPPRVPPSREGGGGHLGAYEAENWSGRSEHEPTEELQGGNPRFSDPAVSTENSAHGGSDRAPLANAVLRRLAEDDSLDATAISVEANGDGILLTGGVDSEEAKQRAERLAGAVEGVGPVTNELQVVRSENLGELPRQTTDRI